MNILIPHSWLLEHLETTATPQDIQKYVSLSGPSIERIYETEGESVYDIEVTTNRVDSMSVRGIAREAAVILTQAGFPSKLKPGIHIPEYMTHPKKEKVGGLHMPSLTQDPSLCGRVLAIVLTDVKRVSSPEWMQMRLRQVGMNTHDAVIDITNYVTHDLGHPCHAFDYDKIMKLGGVIKITKATKGKKFTTLDGAAYETVGGEVVFENGDGEIIDLPGIKGTANTAIDSTTSNVLFWIESIEPTLIRFTSMTHAIRTVAAQLNEKDVDPHLALPVFAQGVKLFETLTDAHVHTDTFTDVFSAKTTMQTVTLPLSRIAEYLGIEISPQRITEILEDLGCIVKSVGKKITVTPPSWRPDITIPEDIVEEIARIYGYHNLPSVLMTGAIPTQRPSDTNFTLEHQSKFLLATLGGYEVYTYSLISEALAHRESSFVLSSLEQTIADLPRTHVKLKNPLTDDMVYLRRTLWASHEEILRSQHPSFVFELANVYIQAQEDKGSTLPTEELRLTLTSTEDPRRLKGVLDALLRSLYLPPVRYDARKKFETILYASDARIGHMLIIPSSEGKQTTIIDVDWKLLVMTANKYPQVKHIPKVAPIIEDMTFTLTDTVRIQTVIETITQVDPLIKRVDYKEIYKQNATFTVYYQPTDETHTEYVSVIRKAIVDAMSANNLGSLVGKIA